MLSGPRISANRKAVGVFLSADREKRQPQSSDNKEQSESTLCCEGLIFQRLAADEVREK